MAHIRKSVVLPAHEEDQHSAQKFTDAQELGDEFSMTTIVGNRSMVLSPEKSKSASINREDMLQVGGQPIHYPKPKEQAAIDFCLGDIMVKFRQTTRPKQTDLQKNCKWSLLAISNSLEHLTDVDKTEQQLGLMAEQFEFSEPQLHVLCLLNKYQNTDAASLSQIRHALSKMRISRGGFHLQLQNSENPFLRGRARGITSLKSGDFVGCVDDYSPTGHVSVVPPQSSKRNNCGGDGDDNEEEQSTGVPPEKRSKLDDFNEDDFLNFDTYYHALCTLDPILVKEKVKAITEPERLEVLELVLSYAQFFSKEFDSTPTIQHAEAMVNKGQPSIRFQLARPVLIESVLQKMNNSSVEYYQTERHIFDQFREVLYKAFEATDEKTMAELNINSMRIGSHKNPTYLLEKLAANSTYKFADNERRKFHIISRVDLLSDEKTYHLKVWPDHTAY